MQPAFRIKVFLKRCLTYAGEMNRFKRVNPQRFRYVNTLRYFPDWVSRLSDGSSPLTAELPWITFGAIQFLEKNLNDSMHAYEFGSGGSTLFLAQRVSTLVSVEHNAEWAARVSSAVAKKGLRNWTCRLIEPVVVVRSSSEPENSPTYRSSGKAFIDRSFEPYARSIDDYPDQFFDLILIDGRARPSCFHHARTKIKPGGFIVLDNAERPHYVSIRKAAAEANWLMYDFSGPAPFDKNFWQTIVWQCNPARGMEPQS